MMKDPPESIIAVPDSNNLFCCHFIYYNMKDSFQGGVYHGKIMFPPDYPNKPPKLIFITPNGKF